MLIIAASFTCLIRSFNMYIFGRDLYFTFQCCDNAVIWKYPQLQFLLSGCHVDHTRWCRNVACIALFVVKLVGSHQRAVWPVGNIWIIQKKQFCWWDESHKLIFVLWQSHCVMDISYLFKIWWSHCLHQFSAGLIPYSLIYAVGWQTGCSLKLLCMIGFSLLLYVHAVHIVHTVEKCYIGW
jgi:hypothetical protein